MIFIQLSQEGKLAQYYADGKEIFSVVQGKKVFFSGTINDLQEADTVCNYNDYDRVCLVYQKQGNKLVLVAFQLTNREYLGNPSQAKKR